MVLSDIGNASEDGADELEVNMPNILKILNDTEPSIDTQQLEEYTLSVNESGAPVISNEAPQQQLSRRQRLEERRRKGTGRLPRSRLELFQERLRFLGLRNVPRDSDGLQNVAAFWDSDDEDTQGANTTKKQASGKSRKSLTRERQRKGTGRAITKRRFGLDLKQNPTDFEEWEEEELLEESETPPEAVFMSESQKVQNLARSTLEVQDKKKSDEDGKTKTDINQKEIDVQLEEYLEPNLDMENDLSFLNLNSVAIPSGLSELNSLNLRRPSIFEIAKEARLKKKNQELDLEKDIPVFEQIPTPEMVRREEFFVTRGAEVESELGNIKNQEISKDVDSGKSSVSEKALIGGLVRENGAKKPSGNKEFPIVEDLEAMEVSPIVQNQDESEGDEIMELTSSVEIGKKNIRDSRKSGGREVRSVERSSDFEENEQFLDSRVNEKKTLKKPKATKVAKDMKVSKGSKTKPNQKKSSEVEKKANKSVKSVKSDKPKKTAEMASPGENHVFKTYEVPMSLYEDNRENAENGGKVGKRRMSLGGAGLRWENGVRKSSRMKIQPLEFWRNERMVYGRSHTSLPTFQHIVKVAPDPLWPLPSGRKKRNCQVFSPKDLRTFPLHAET